MVDFAMDVFRQLYKDKEVPKELKDKRVTVVSELKSLQSAVVPITTILEDPHVTDQIPKRMRHLLRSRRVSLLPQSLGAAERQKLHERAVGKTCLRNPYAKLGHCPGRRESDQGDHRHGWSSRRYELRRDGKSSSSPTTESLAHSLVSFRLLQPSQRQGSHHRSVLVPTSILEHDPNDVSPHSALSHDGRHH